MSRPNVTRVQSATEWPASVHTLHMPKPHVTHVQSATEWTLWLGLALPLSKKRKLQSGTGQNLLTKFVAGRAKKRGRQ